MNVLFLTLVDFDSIEEHNIYADLLREFRRNGHKIYAVSPVEKRKGRDTYLVEEQDSTILRLKIGNVQKTNLIEKGISTVTLEHKYIQGIKQYFKNVRFDLILYSTPPITLQKAVEYVKKRDSAKTYLLLKDIFPQNSVDLGMLTKSGVKGLIYKYFRLKEKNLYRISDYIGCMSQANVEYILEHNAELNDDRVEVCPNSIEPMRFERVKNRIEIRNKYGLPVDKQIFVYGGNLGKPQGIDFVIECLRTQKDNSAVYFLLVGSGTEYNKLKAFFDAEKPENAKLLEGLPREEYEQLAGACDVGLIFLDYRFTIPNFPSRMLSYMQSGLPILAVTDESTDVGDVIVDNGFGWWCPSNASEQFKHVMEEIAACDITEKGNCARQYLENNYSVRQSYGIIMEAVGRKAAIAEGL